VPTTFLVPLDLGAEADRALPVARALADRTGGRLEVVVVTDARTQAAADKDEVRRHAHKEGVVVDAVHLRYEDDAVTGVLAQARESDATLCLASHAYTPVVAALFSSVGADIVRGDAQPLVVVGPNCATAAPVGDRLLACLGGRSDRGVPAVAAAWARELGAKVEVLTAGDGDTAAAYAPAVGAAQLLAREGIDATYDVVGGRPVDAILAAAERAGAGLVVMGPGPRRGRGPALGHIARAVLRRTSRPVLLVPEPSPEPAAP
jgi:nucleotide-binding universal stress UspA family protein